jgi:hypothetical protein
LGDFFTNSSGHPAIKRSSTQFLKKKFYDFAANFYLALKCFLKRTKIQGCQMHYFQAKNPNLDNFGGTCNGRCWYILWRFGLFYGNLVFFVANWFIMVIWYIFPRFGKL